MKRSASQVTRVSLVTFRNEATRAADLIVAAQPVLDPLLGRATLVVKPHDGTIREREIRHDEAHAREQLADVVLDFRHDPSGRGPAVRLATEEF